MYFDWLIYRELNPDLKKEGLLKEEQLINHFRRYGIKEKRKYNIYQVYPDFNHIAYKKKYKDLENLQRIQLERHWVEFGTKEKRSYTNGVSTNVGMVKSKTTSIPKASTKPKSPVITFIIPTIGRATLNKTITSIQNQSSNNWHCIIIFDGIDIPSNISQLVKDNKRFTLVRINKVGCLNHGARVRNEGLKLVKGGWVGFVDDDDTLSPYYVEHMNNYILSNSNIKCIIFRMLYSDNNVIPKINSHTFYEGNVGISFCFNAELLRNGFYFTPSSLEDYVLLNRIRSSGYKIVMSSKIGYFVRPVLGTTVEYVKSIKHIENVMSDIIIN
jgi:hypothetical protein